MITAKRLSSEQKLVLTHIHRRHLWVAAGQREYWEDRVYPNGEIWLAWQPLHDPTGQFTRSQAASLSRTLRRLEQRGLVERGNTITGSGRTTAVHLTLEGFRLAESLTV